MQVHAVPESERAFDAAGRQLPWGYEYADGDTHGQRRYVEEKGPFGRSTRRRGLSRSKTTGTPARKEDQNRAANLKAIDEIFTQVKASAPKAVEQPPAAPQPPQPATGAPALPPSQTSVAKEPTEVILYGFSSETQWAAIDFYERVSEGLVYEDYDRHPPNSKYNTSLSLNRTAAAARSLSAAALRKKNTYCGGNHWIKVTFDSPEAADRACHYSPHLLHGHAVFAELYRGAGPARGDIAVPSSHARLAGDVSLHSSPSNTSTTLRGSAASPTHSDTASSATATASAAPPLRHRPSARSAQSAPAAVATPQTSFESTATAALSAQTPGAAPADPAPVAPPPLRVRGAKRAVLLPAEQALLPVGNKWQQLLGSLPLIRLFVGGATEVIGNEVPRKEDGAFDWEAASMYWKVWAWIDSLFGTDFLGIGGDD